MMQTLRQLQHHAALLRRLHDPQDEAEEADPVDVFVGAAAAVMTALPPQRGSDSFWVGLLSLNGDTNVDGGAPCYPHECFAS